jgi:hypothetical protein
MPQETLTHTKARSMSAMAVTSVDLNFRWFVIHIVCAEFVIWPKRSGIIDL